MHINFEGAFESIRQTRQDFLNRVSEASGGEAFGPEQRISAGRISHCVEVALDVLVLCFQF